MNQFFHQIYYPPGENHKFDDYKHIILYQTTYSEVPLT